MLQRHGLPSLRAMHGRSRSRAARGLPRTQCNLIECAQILDRSGHAAMRRPPQRTLCTPLHMLSRCEEHKRAYKLLGAPGHVGAARRHALSPAL